MREDTQNIIQTPHLRIDRPALYSQDNLNDISSYAKPKVNKVKEFFRAKTTDCKPGKCIKGILPIFDWLPQYNWKLDLPCDVIAGVTVAIMHIPQGLGYALLANVPAITGIYMALFPNIIYFFFGTSRHNSMGTFAVITLLVGRSVVEYAKNPNYTHNVLMYVNGTSMYVPQMYEPIEIGCSVTLIVSFFHFIMYFCRMGIICTLLSDALVNSFICGAGFHIFTSQIKEVFGVKPKRFSGPLQLINTYIDIVRCLIYATPKEKYAIYGALIISAICITLLLLNVYFFKPWLEKYTKIPFPLELVLIICGVFAAQGLELKKEYHVADIGFIPKGIPGPQLPYLNLIQELLLNSFVTAIVAYAVSMSMALILAEGENYEVDGNQEFLAHALGNFFSSFFHCIVYGASLSRSMVLRGVGGRTQIVALVAAGIIVVVLLWIADFFQDLPRAVLASIIIVALKKILMQVTDFPRFWRQSKLDGAVWLIVFAAVIIIDIDYGLGIGFLLSIGAIFLQGLKAYTCLLGNIPNTDLYLDITRYKAAIEINGLKIIHYRGALNFATRGHLKLEILRLTGINLKKEIRKKIKLDKKKEKVPIDALANGGAEGVPPVTSFENLGYVEDGCEGAVGGAEPVRYTLPTFTSSCPIKNVHCIILDFSALSSIDPAGAGQVKKIKDEFKKIDIPIIVAGCSGPVYEKIKKCGHLQGDSTLYLFPTIHDAVHHAQSAFQRASEQTLGAAAL